MWSTGVSAGSEELKAKVRVAQRNFGAPLG
jgi:hypothetical protein